MTNKKQKNIFHARIIIFEHESHEFHELFRADDTSIYLQVTVATATENLWKSVQSVGV